MTHHELHFILLEFRKAQTGFDIGWEYSNYKMWNMTYIRTVHPIQLRIISSAM